MFGNSGFVRWFLNATLCGEVDVLSPTGLLLLAGVVLSNWLYGVEFWALVMLCDEGLFRFYSASFQLNSGGYANFCQEPLMKYSARRAF